MARDGYQQRLIIVEHKPGKLEEGKRKDYPLKNFEKAQIKNTPLTAQFQTGNSRKKRSHIRKTDIKFIHP